MAHHSDNQDFTDIAALTIHDVKNNLAQLASEAESRGDIKSMQVAMEASGTLSGLLCFYKSETHNLHVQIELQDPAELLVDLIAAIATNHPAKSSISIIQETSQAPGIWFYDRTLIQMVLANALQNALRYARHQITITVADYSGQLMFQIQDDGDGYPQAVLENLDSHSPVTRHGTGLGLRLAQRVMALHQNQGKSGSIRLSNRMSNTNNWDITNSAKNNGACFQLFLP
ncbi:sensor histidine kinase [Undibacterium sp. Di24W]|uniref:sensor histidine kinase n=1 Tax=Undibacterium sp. Di24W TaxID=3413033 RepID=UPI003BF454B5